MKITHLKDTPNAPLGEASPVGVPLGEPVSHTRVAEVERPDQVDTGIWECTPGRWRRQIVEQEFCHFISGRGTFTPDDGEPIAFACVFAPDESGSALLNNLHARPDRKGEGAGSALMDAAARWARERGAAAMHLKVVQGNEAAARFYERRGWRFAGTEQDEFGGRASTVLVYRLALE